MHHRTVTCFDPFTQQPVAIDERIAAVVTAMWECGIRTLQSCEYDSLHDSAWVQFGDVRDASLFVGVLFAGSGEDDELWQRQRDQEVATPEPSTSRMGWRWKAAPAGAVDDPPDTFTFDVMVEFPVHDLPEIERRLRRAKADV